MEPSVITHRNRVAALARSRVADDPALLEARRDLAAAKIDQYIERTLESAPPLTPAQSQHLAGLLNGGRP